METKNAKSLTSTTIVAYISFPVAEAVPQNLVFIRNVIETIHIQQPNVVPFIPCLFDWMDAPPYTDESLQKLARKSRTVFLQRGFIDEMWLFGSRIDNNMSHEIVMAILNDIKVVPKSPETARAYASHFANLKTADEL